MEKPSFREIMEEQEAEKDAKKGGWCHMMIGGIVVNGMPLKIDGTRFRQEDNDDEDDLEDVMVFDDTRMKNLIEMLHYDKNDLEKYVKAMHQDFADPERNSKNIDEVIKTCKRYDEPQHMVSIYDAIINGRIKFATCTTKSFVIIYVGTDLTKPLKTQVKNCIRNRECTFSVTRNAPVRQKGYVCQTCFPGRNTMVVCESCARKCHKGHSIRPRTNGPTQSNKTFMFCDCGHILPCKCLSK